MAAWVTLKGLQAILALTPAIVLERKDAVKAKSSEVGQKKDAGASRPSSAKG